MPRTKTQSPRVSRVRKAIEDFTVGKLKVVPLGFGEVFLVPSDTEHGAYYVVAHIGIRQWVCSCKGFRFDKTRTDTCKHVKERMKGKGEL